MLGLAGPLNVHPQHGPPWWLHDIGATGTFPGERERRPIGWNPPLMTRRTGCPVSGWCDKGASFMLWVISKPMISGCSAVGMVWY